MAEYIDRMKVRIAIIDTKWICDQDEDVAYDMIDSIPAADVEEVKHGRWIKAAAYTDGVLNTAYCSVCKVFLPIGEWDYDPYCRHCGAKMDGGKDETK